MPEQLQRKSLSLDVKFLEDGPDDAGTVELYAAVFDVVDRVNEVILPGAFLNLDEFVADGCGLKEHRIDDSPIAIVLSAVQDGHGLRIKARFHSTPTAQEVRTIVRERKAEGKSVQCSIGYKVAQATKQRREGREVLVIKALRVYEFSFTNLAANPHAGVIDVKSAGGAATPEDPMDEDGNPGVWGSLQRWLGLEKKSAPATADAPPDHAELKAFALELKSLGERGADLAADLAERSAGCTAIAGTMIRLLDPTDPDAGPPMQAKSDPEPLRLLRLRAAALELGDLDAEIAAA